MAAKHLRLWGKAQPIAGWRNRIQPVAFHCLPVAAGKVQLCHARFPDEYRPYIPLDVFNTALHDIGKFTTKHQAISPPDWPEDILGPFAEPPDDDRHDTLGYRILMSDDILRQMIRPGRAMAGWGL